MNAINYWVKYLNRFVYSSKAPENCNYLECVSRPQKKVKHDQIKNKFTFSEEPVSKPVKS